MHGKEQKPSVKALEGRAQKAARASEKAAAAEAAAEAEEAARWEIGAPGKSAREERAERAERKAEARAERRAIARREEQEEKRRERRRPNTNLEVERLEKKEKMARLIVAEAMLEARTMEEAMYRIGGLYKEEVVYGEMKATGGIWVMLKRTGHCGDKEKVQEIKRGKWKEYEEYERQNIRKEGKETRGAALRERIYEKWMGWEEEGAKEGERVREMRREGERRGWGREWAPYTIRGGWEKIGWADEEDEEELERIRDEGKTWVKEGQSRVDEREFGGVGVGYVGGLRIRGRG